MEIVRVSKMHGGEVNCEVADIHTSVGARQVIHVKAGTLEALVNHFQDLSLMRIHCIENIIITIITNESKRKDLTEVIVTHLKLPPGYLSRRSGYQTDERLPSENSPRLHSLRRLCYHLRGGSHRC